MIKDTDLECNDGGSYRSGYSNFLYFYYYDWQNNSNLYRRLPPRNKFRQLTFVKIDIKKRYKFVAMIYKYIYVFSDALIPY